MAATARRAKGKKSVAIGDISGFKIPYKDLKTTWEGFRVEPEDFDPKHPQLTPAKNVIDATALFKPRPDTDPENVVVPIGYSFDPFIPIQQRPPVGVPSFGFVGFVLAAIDDVENATGVEGTGQLGSFTLFITLDAIVSGVAGTGAVGTETVEAEIVEAGVAGTGQIGAESLEAGIIATGVAATGQIGTESLEAEIVESGVAGTGEVAPVTEEGDGNIQISVTGFSGIGGVGEVGNEISELVIFETGLAGTGQIGTESVEVNEAWGEDAWSTGVWGE
jgi:hypothetical protein